MDGDVPREVYSDEDEEAAEDALAGLDAESRARLRDLAKDLMLLFGERIGEYRVSDTPGAFPRVAAQYVWGPDHS